ncbi:MAG: hypothetical protein AB7O52_07590 [Planctomycetota bacterium]
MPLLPPAPWSLLFGADGALTDRGRAVLAALAEVDHRDVAALAGLRKHWDAETVAVAIELTASRAKGVRKFPLVRDLVGDREGVEQATSACVAVHKAARFARHSPTPVFDLCAGIGGDAMSLAQVSPVIACDHDPARAWMCERNLTSAPPPLHPVEVRCVDVTTWALARSPMAQVHLDPSRRQEHAGSGRSATRRWRYRDYQPGPDFVEALLDQCPNAAVKLGPGVDLHELPLAPARELEFIQEHGDLVQAVLWGEGLAQHPGATATILPGGHHLCGPAAQLANRAGEIDRYLVTAQPAAERAGLLGVVAALDGAQLDEVAPGLGVLTGSRVPTGPWVTAFEVLSVMPWRTARVREWLAEHRAGVVEVKTRGGAVDANQARAALRGRGDQVYTVFGLRVGASVRAVITRRVP